MREQAICSATLSALIGMALPATVLAQQSNSTVSTAVEEIVVQARRRDERLLDVPVSVTALTNEKLQNLGITDIVAVQTVTPGLNIAEGVDDSTARFFIRGIGTATPTVGIEPSVPVYIDDVYTPSGLGSAVDLFALDRVEVLRGPQGTLYGRNSFGGAVKIYTKSFTNEAEGEFSVAAGDHGRKNLKGEVRLPLIEDRLWFGGGLAHLEDDGYQRNVYTNTRGWAEDSTLSRAKLQFKPTDALQFTVTYDRNKKDAAAKQPKITNINNDVANAGLSAYPGIVPSLQQSSTDPDVIDSDVVGNTVIDMEGTTWIASWQATDAIQFKYLGASRTMQNERLFDIDGTAAPFLLVHEDFRVRGESHELQLNFSGGPLTGVLGVFYYDENTRSRSAQVNGFLSFLDINQDANVVTDPMGRKTSVDIRSVQNGLRQETTSKAAFANASYAITDATNISAGVRWTKDEKKQRGADPAITFIGGSQADMSGPVPFDIPPGVTILDTTFGAQGSGARDYTEVTPEIGIDHHLRPDLMVYANYREGFQGGTIFPYANTVPGSEVSTKQQTVSAFEIGAKGAFFDNRLSLNAALYYNKFDDLIVSVRRAVPIEVSATGFAGVPANAGEADSKGVELEARFSVTDDFVISASGAYNDFEVSSVIGLDPADPTNQNRIELADTFLDVYTLAPEFQFMLGGEYQVQLGSIGTLNFNVAAAYRSEMGINAANVAESSGIGLVTANPATDQYFISKSFTNVTAGVSYLSSDGHWRVDLSGRNLLDERRPVASIAVVPGLFGAIQQWNDPRQWTAGVQYRF
jgi:iron complex outermembrane receptor protein